MPFGVEPAGPPVSGTVISMIGVPTSTVVPASTSRADTVPVHGDGRSTSDFAVSISTIVWFTSTVSPTATCHSTISASVSPSPTSGSGNLWVFKLALSAHSLGSLRCQCAKARSTASSTRSTLGRYSCSCFATG